MSSAVLTHRAKAGPPSGRRIFHRALWKKTIGESWFLLASLCALALFFAWLFVWLITKIKLNALLTMLVSSLKDFESLSGVPFQQVATEEGRIALAFIDPVVYLAVIVWAIGRGSDMVSGELERGTLEMVLAQPLRRITVYASKAAVTIAGLVLICVVLWCGLTLGIHLLVKEKDLVRPAMYIPPAMNLLGMGFAMAGITAFVSSWDRYRWRTIGIMGGFYAVSVVLKVVARMAPEWESLGYASILWTFEPQRLVGTHADAWRLLVEYNTPLVVVGMLSYIAGAIIFCRRDLPAPL
jgi:ABC-2 type transport system permease protein